MYLVAGSNLFGQWFSDDSIFTKLRAITNANNDEFDLNHAKLVHINWSYNIFRTEDKFFISGAWRCKEKQIAEIKLPKELDNISDVNVTGTNSSLILISEKTNTLYVLNLEDVHKIKKVNLNIETPLHENGDTIKRRKLDENISKVVVANDFYMCLTSQGTVYCGIMPSYLDTSHCAGKICDIHCGYEHCILLTDEGRVYTWGNGRRLQLGHGDISNVDTPTEVHALAGVKITKVRAGGWHTLALSESGDLYAWGWNDIGQLGVKQKENLSKDDPNSYSIPTLVDLFDDNQQEVVLHVKDIACGSRHSAIMLKDNTVWTTGYNKYGQLGLSPKEYPSLNYFKKVYQCSNNSKLMCGPWSTIVES